MLFLFFLFLKKNLLFIYFERERESASRRGAEKEGDIEPEAGFELSAESDAGLKLTDLEIMT